MIGSWFSFKRGRRTYPEAGESGRQSQALRAALIASPMDADLHAQLACLALTEGRLFLAYAEHKTASFLGAPYPGKDCAPARCEDVSRSLSHVSHNRYFRLRTLAESLRANGLQPAMSVLDVGGGNGELAAFLTDCQYVLAEPSVNGISGQTLPFPDASFDFVVACHVLEHIQSAERGDFLRSLVARARRAVILLNPFAQPGSFERERLELVLKITGAEWAREHLDCALPEIETVLAVGRSLGVDVSVRPSGSLIAGLALVFMDHFGSKGVENREAWQDVNRFLNKHCCDMEECSEYPISHLVVFRRVQ